MVDEAGGGSAPSKSRRGWWREGQGVEGTVLAHELDGGHRKRQILAPPPSSGWPVASAHSAVGIYSIGVRPDIGKLPSMPGGARAAPDRDAPVEIAGDAAILQPSPSSSHSRARSRSRAPASRSGVDPGAQAVAEARTGADAGAWSRALRDWSSRDRRARLDQLGRVELPGLPSSRTDRRGHGIAWSGRCPSMPAVGQGSGRRRSNRPGRLGDIDQPGFGEAAGEMLGQRVVARRGGAAEMVEAEPKPSANPSGSRQSQAQ